MKVLKSLYNDNKSSLKIRHEISTRFGLISYMAFLNSSLEYGTKAVYIQYIYTRQIKIL